MSATMHEHCRVGDRLLAEDERKSHVKKQHGAQRVTPAPNACVNCLRSAGDTETVHRFPQGRLREVYLHRCLKKPRGMTPTRFTKSDS